MENLQIEEVLLIHMQKQTETRNETHSSDMTRLQSQEKIVFWGFIIAAGLTMIIIVTGIVLIFNDRLAVAIVAEVAGIVPGTGILILKGLSKQITEHKDRISSLRAEDLKVLTAIQIVLLIPDNNKRTDAIVSLATKLTGAVK